MNTVRLLIIMCSVLAISACGRLGFPERSGERDDRPRDSRFLSQDQELEDPNRETIWDAFGPQQNEQKVQVNRYLWRASLDILDFLPVQSVDPFTGVIVTGYGTPPGSGRAYRATIHISDPALDARSLNVALQSRNGAVGPDTTRAVEDAILTRARQLRIADRNF